MLNISSIKGFKLAAIDAGLRYKKRSDLGLIVAAKQTVAAGVFTTSLTKAAPVLWSEEKLKQPQDIRAVLVNAGQANAQTGADGLEDCRISAQKIAEKLSLKPQQVLLASTGVIGQRINMEALTKSLDPLVANLASDNFLPFSESILTTDLSIKNEEGKIVIEGSEINLWGAAKGSGMIAPNMATMLAFILTDTAITAQALQAIVKDVNEATFNRITVDGDTSTNDTFIVLASQKAGNKIIDCPFSPTAAVFKSALYKVAFSLAKQIVLDGEGANHLITIKVKGARTDNEALKAARTVSESPLVKTAFFGQDANWGRILAALGRSGAIFDPYKVNLFLDDVFWVKDGLDNGQNKNALEVMAKKEYVLTIDLQAGSSNTSFMSCDLSYEYIKINGSYRS